MKDSIFYALASALVTAALILGGPLQAQTAPADPQTYVSLVRTGDLDLGSRAGERKLEHRLALAAREVCGTASDVDLRGKKAVRECRKDAIDRATVQREQLLATAARGEVIAITATR